MSPLNIALVPANAVVLEALLALVNGRSRSHTFNSSEQLLIVADEAQAELEALDLGYGDPRAIGATYTAQSGDVLPTNCQYGARTTLVSIELSADCWSLTGAESDTLPPCAAPRRARRLP
jgi:hypothetical protein